jgi:hypothetical protein
VSRATRRSSKARYQCVIGEERGSARRGQVVGWWRGVVCVEREIGNVRLGGQNDNKKQTSKHEGWKVQSSLERRSQMQSHF